MAHALPSHLRIALFDERAILLDIRADRYRSLGARAAHVFQCIARDETVTDVAALEDLLAADILCAGNASYRPLDIPVSERIISSSPALSARATRWLRGFRALLSVMCIQSARGFDASLRSITARKASRTLRRDIDAAVAVAQAYRTVRTRIPIRPVCLRDSMALMILLVDAGLDATLVLGVRIDPFAAHSWVQAGSILLSDDLDVVAEFTPILAL